MTTPNTTSTAAQALLDALAQPGLDDARRRALIAALEVAMSGAAPVAAVATTPDTRSKPTRTAARKTAPARKAATRVTFTKEIVAELAVGHRDGKHRLVYDTTVPQLAVRVSNASASYLLVVWDRTRRGTVFHTLGSVDRLTIEQARTNAKILLGQQAKGEDIRRRKLRGASLREVIATWHREKSARGMRTADEAQAKLLDYLGRIADKPADEVRREDIGAIHHGIATKARRRVAKRIDDTLQVVEVGEPGLPATADKWLATLHAVYEWAQAKALLPENPCAGIQRAFDAKGAARTNYLHGDGLVRFWRALDDDPDADVRDAILLLLYTGQRRGNVMTMRWDDIDLQAGLWTLGASSTKQRAAQTTPLVAQAREILARRHDDAGTPWVFPAVRVNADGELGSMSDTRLREAWARICTAAGIADLRVHDLRHTSGSWLARLGANTAVRQKALGHKTSAMAEKYAHLELDPVADAMQRVGDAIGAAAKRPRAEPKPLRKGRAAK